MEYYSAFKKWNSITYACVCSVTQPCPTLCDLKDCSPPGSSAHGFLQARMLEWVAISSSNTITGINLKDPVLKK